MRIFQFSVTIRFFGESSNTFKYGVTAKNEKDAYIKVIMSIYDDISDRDVIESIQLFTII